MAWATVILALINPDLTLGNVITMVVSVGSVLVAAWRITARLVRMEAIYEMKMALLWDEYCKKRGMDSKA